MTDMPAPMPTCPACNAVNFPDWVACEDCGCPKGAKPDVQKAHWIKHKSTYLLALNTSWGKARREPPVQRSSPWRVLGIDTDGKQAPVWTSNPVDEAQAREWVDWTVRRVASGKAAFTRVLLIDPSGAVLESRPCTASQVG